MNLFNQKYLINLFHGILETQVGRDRWLSFVQPLTQSWAVPS